MHEHWQFLTSVEYMSVDLFAMCYGHQHELRDLKIHIIIIYDTIRDAILTCARKPT